MKIVIPRDLSKTVVSGVAQRIMDSNEKHWFFWKISNN